MKFYNKHIFNTIFYILLLSFILQGCIEDVKDTNLPSIEQKLVVSSFITPGDSIRVKISKSTPIHYNQELTNWDDYYEPLTNASVFITNIETGVSKEIPFNSAKEYYLLTPSEFMIEKGQEYMLTASAVGLKSITAKTSIPLGTPQIQCLSIDTIYTESQDFEDSNAYEYFDLVVSGYVVDIPNEKNYYTIGAQIKEEFYSFWEDTTYMFYFFRSGASFTDSDNDGKDIPFKSDIYLNENSTYSLVLLSSDEHYYRYHKSFYNWNSENPFSEPTPLYSNSDGGLGIFASVVIINVNNTEKTNLIFSDYLCRHKR